MLTEFPLPAMTIVVYKMLKVVDLMALPDVRAIYVVYEMIPYAVAPNIPMHVIVVELSLDFVVVLLCPVLALLLEIQLPKCTEKIQMKISKDKILLDFRLHFALSAFRRQCRRCHWQYSSTNL